MPIRPHRQALGESRSVVAARRPSGALLITGGRIEEYTYLGENYVVHLFTTPGPAQFEVAGGTLPIDVIIIGGGGGGASGAALLTTGGGGGAGALVTSLAAIAAAPGIYDIVVGANGAGGGSLPFLSDGGQGGTTTMNYPDNTLLGQSLGGGGGYKPAEPGPPPPFPGEGGDNTSFSGGGQNPSGGGGGASSTANGATGVSTGGNGGAGTILGDAWGPTMSVLELGRGGGGGGSSSAGPGVPFGGTTTGAARSAVQGGSGGGGAGTGQPGGGGAAGLVAIRYKGGNGGNDTPLFFWDFTGTLGATSPDQLSSNTALRLTPMPSATATEIVTGPTGSSQGVLLNEGGVQGYFEADASATLDALQNNSFSLLWWSKTNGTVSFSRFICKLLLDVTGYETFQVDDNGTMFFQVAGGGSYYFVSVPPGVLLPNVWQSWACVYDKPAGTIQIYTDTVLQATAVGVPSLTGNTTPLCVGRSPSIGGPLWRGSFALFSIWNKALSATDVVTYRYGPV